MRVLICILFWIITSITCWSQHTLSGTVRDKDGVALAFAHLLVSPDSITTVTDELGNFKVKVSAGKKTVLISYVGYEAYSNSIQVSSDQVINPILIAKANQLKEVVVRDQRDYSRELFERNQTSTNVISKEEVTSIPVLGGEADLIKTLQLLPGTIRGVEGTSDLFIRGGAADQNLVLLDGAPIYNTSHLFGFLSVFNPDVLDKVEAMNGGFPAEFGGRLSSILNVKSVSRHPTRTSFSGDIGLIASRFFLQQPLIKDKASVWIAARRTYIDQVLKLVKEELPYFFYDINGKIILTPNESNLIEISHYSGEDKLDLFRDRNGDGDGFLTQFTSGNNTQSVTWKHQFHTNTTSSLNLYRTAYKYNINNSFEENNLSALSDIQDLGARLMFERDSLRYKGSVKFGTEWTRHSVSPNVINTKGTVAEFFESSTTSGKLANELAVFVQYDVPLSDRLNLATGLRLSSALVPRKAYLIPEPRLSLRYALSDDQALKLSYSRMSQYIHRISNSAVTAPTDIWYPVTDSIRPQTSHQIAAGWQKTFPGFYLSVEGYYKSMHNLIGFEEGTNLFLNNEFQSKLIQGKGRAYGLEVLLKKQSGRLTGWLSYTLSWSWRKFDEIDAGWFHSRYDRRHNGALVMQYALNKRLSASLVWEFISGARFTPVIGQYALLAPSLSGVELIPVYSEINGVKLSDTHRLDIGLRYSSKPGKKFQWHWFAGIYNTYNRASPVGINIEQDEEDGSLRYTQPGLFGLLPFISYGFKI
jgi:hypothetical protein